MCRHVGLQWAGLADSLSLVEHVSLLNSKDHFLTSPQASLVQFLLRAAFLTALSQCDGWDSLLIGVWRALNSETETMPTDSLFELAMKIKCQLEDHSSEDDLRYYEGKP